MELRKINLPQYILYYGTTIIVANEISEKNFEQELTEDLLSNIHYFSIKSYSHRKN